MKKFLVILFLELILSNSSYANCSSGNCTNGQGTYTAADGLKYVGEFKDGNATGQGILIDVGMRMLTGQCTIGIDC